MRTLHISIDIKPISKTFQLLLLIAYLTTTSLNAQDHIIKGKVIDAVSQNPLAFVNIVYNNYNLGTTTSIDGEFKIVSSEPIDFIRVSYLGYEALRIDPDIYINKENIIIKLKPKQINIEEVVVYPGENPAHTLAISINCSWKIGTPSVFARIGSAAGWRYLTGSSPLRLRRYGWTDCPWIGPGRISATSTARS